jgi:hypothetical protein
LSVPLAVHPARLALDRKRLEEPAPNAETDSIEQAITLLATHPTESIMSLQTTLFAAAALAFSVVAHAGPQATVKLERVVVTGKATQEIAQLPRVVVTGHAQRVESQVVAQLPRVVIVGFSEATLARQTLAAAKTGTKHA